jgi:hypothetical protein
MELAELGWLCPSLEATLAVRELAGVFRAGGHSLGGENQAAGRNAAAGSPDRGAEMIKADDTRDVADSNCRVT